MESTGKCDVCGEDKKLYVRCSGLGAMSFAYCENCLRKGFEPYWLIVGTAAVVGYPQGCANWFLNLIDTQLPEFGITKEKFLQDTDNVIKTFYEKGN